MIIVVDTNIFIGVCIGNGSAAKVIASCLKGEHNPLMGTALFSEYEDVLGRTSLFKKSRLNHEEREELLDIFMATTLWTKVYYNWRPNLPDEGDNHLIELAIAGNAQYIVTRKLGDIEGDFKRAELSFPELNIVSPEDFLKESQP